MRIEIDPVLLIGMAVICIVIWLVLTTSNRFPARKRGCIVVDELKLGIGTGTLTIHYDRKTQEIAYKIWVEMVTRKTGIEFDSKDDVITEVYNSWYDSFRAIRELLKQIPASNSSSSTKLIETTINILNRGLRPHLTKWQARYRKWYANHRETEKYPQDLQLEFPEYDQLIDDLMSTNHRLMYYTETLKQIWSN